MSTIQTLKKRCEICSKLTMKILERYWSTINRTNIARNTGLSCANPYPTNILKEECKSKDMITAKFSKTIENLTNKNPEVISRDVQTNSNPPTKEPPL